MWIYIYFYCNEFVLDSIKSATPNSWEIKNMREGETLIQMEQKRTFE